MGCLSRKDECERILCQFGTEKMAPIMSMLERQFAVLQNRTQVMMGLCGIVITTTGFSGRIIAGTNLTAQVLIINGIALVLLAAAVVVWSVLHLRWLTQQPGKDLTTWLMSALAYRDRKTEAYRVGVSLLLVGLTLYVAAIAIMLMYPDRDVVQLNR
ncbi:MAG: hypothetical protein CSA75_03490 [Sorangium cellulosum]|nr:MAG: hypothetical protein CSA75_03490 [Sorangium cellulosum]